MLRWPLECCITCYLEDEEHSAGSVRKYAVGFPQYVSAHELEWSAASEWNRQWHGMSTIAIKGEIKLIWINLKCRSIFDISEIFRLVQTMSYRRKSKCQPPLETQSDPAPHTTSCCRNDAMSSSTAGPMCWAVSWVCHGDTTQFMAIELIRTMIIYIFIHVIYDDKPWDFFWETYSQTNSDVQNLDCCQSDFKRNRDLICCRVL